MKIGEYLIQAIRRTGTRHVFGIPGDYVLNFYQQLASSRLKVITTADEQGAGFAADGYGRQTGFGVVCATYGVGGLKLVNSTAQAYAERSPVLVVSGGPGVAERRGDPLLHHKVRLFETQLNVFKEVTAAQAVLDDPGIAAAEINRVIAAVRRTKRPGYLELPRDLVDAEISTPHPSAEEPPPPDPEAGPEALEEVLEIISAASRPVVVAGIEVHRFGLQHALLDFLERSGMPFVTGVLGKSVISEKCPGFLGVYAGAMSPDNVREAVEGSDCLIAVGHLVTDISTGVFTTRIEPAHSIVLGSESLAVRHHVFPGVGMKYFLAALTDALPRKKTPPLPEREISPFVPEVGHPVTVGRLIDCLNSFLDEFTTVVADPGDALYGALDLWIHGNSEFLAPAYYNSLGFAIPAALAIQLAAPERRPLVLTGDGSFQMSGVELSTAVRHGLSPIVVVFNNGGYGTFRQLMKEQPHDIQNWLYAEFPHVIGGGEGYTVEKEDELAAALAAGRKNDRSPTVIDVRLGPDDCSPRLRALTETLKNRV